MGNALTTRTEFGAQETTGAMVETASTAIAAQSKAMVEARYIMAMRQPRNWDQVRQDLIAECKRPAFAHNKSAWYKKPIGKGVEGLGIRFVEVALRCMRNVLVETTMIFEDESKEIQRVSVTDLESNLTYPLDVRVSKTVERSKPMDDGSYISVRKNSYGNLTYTVPANDDDLLNKRAAQISKAIRTLGLRIIPGDLQDEAEVIIKAIRKDEAARDPASERKRIADAFMDIGVKASDLTHYLGHTLDTCSPDELVDLRGIYGAIKDGEATWKQVMENKTEQSGGTESGNENHSNGTPASNRPAAATCSDDEFKQKTAGWRKQIVDKKKTPDELIAMIETRQKLTEEQKLQIDAWSHEND
ncbi:hypothetical protein HDG34_005834 [Paraburkholderia sp. HC6.4b]|uniref:hypothetical protein n=1 Tax=unclassified Paraburkholderia TaxID=2615204 RepID=UPI001622E06E|nr:MULTISPECIES: hypothetical protein [unclassified Paraburkholderia]MBB5411868.1 hypothetical protein [Paraburkholderia sp. HC6.4b]MBB5450180.1 hypothetical protein [Paraburkholderia sp. Kb1A]